MVMIFVVDKSLNLSISLSTAFHPWYTAPMMQLLLPLPMVTGMRMMGIFDQKEEDDGDKGLKEEEEEEISVVEPTAGRGDRLAPWPICVANEDG